MKRYGSFLMLMVIVFATLASNVLPSNASSTLNLIATVTKTPTRKPTSTKVPVFGPSTSNRTVPRDIHSVLEEIGYFGMGGGGDDEDQCKNYRQPTVVADWFDVEQLQRAWVDTCGWKSNKRVSVALFRPDGTSKKETLTVYGSSNYGEVYWSYLPTAFDPVGTYKVDFSNGEQRLHFEFNVSRITTSGAALFWEEQEVQVYNFRPNEKVRLFRYDISSDKLVLQDWQEFYAGADGKLRIKLISLNGFFAVLGEKTGEFHVTEGFAQSILKSNTPVVSNRSLCQLAPKSKVAVGSAARVTFTDGTPTRIRKEPTTSSKIIGRIPEGTRFLIVGGHKCNDGYTWWNIELANGTRGWMAEGTGGTYYLEPMNYLQQTCSEPRSRLYAGAQARVARVDGSNMRIRTEPGFSQNIVDKVPEGTLLTILRGPRCVDGNNWWYIRTKNGKEGWMTESQNGVYLLEPAR